MLHAEGFKGFLIFLVAAGIIVPLFHRARIGTVPGFLLVGVVLGPFGLGRLADTHPWIGYVTFDNPQRVVPLAELGIIFLLFLLGLELSLQRLWQHRALSSKPPSPASVRRPSKGTTTTCGRRLAWPSRCASAKRRAPTPMSLRVLATRVCTRRASWRAGR